MSGAEARRINREMLKLEEDNAPRIGASLSQSKARKLSMVDLACPLHYDLQVEVFARVSCIDYWKLQFLNKRFSQLLKSGAIFRVRQERRLVKPYVVMVTSYDITRWIMHTMIVVGRELEGIVVWRYELEMNKWFKGPAMIAPRVMYGSASHGNDAFFAGGIKFDENGIPEVVSKAEKFSADTKTWTEL
ncbi:unnamed protein product [Arabis nemorensis]|uniref:F-box domain-containing protein n=1 Tax=Arabis nemorensis TaxID=586526 RepID=A0A565C730_9BRAS|nr:unnamed protein product [Arabis nemorensis]